MSDGTTDGRFRARVLLVEDDDDAAHLLGAAVELMGHEVALAHDGPVALSLALSFVPDVVLIDIGLPVMDGHEVAKRLRNVTRHDVPVVAVTAHGTDQDRQRSVEAGFVEHLVKPIDLRMLEQVLDRILGLAARR
jgi:CheY-like chemotaxis protein